MKRKSQELHTENTFITMSKLEKLLQENFNVALDDSSIIMIKGGGGDPPPWIRKKKKG